MDQCSIEIAAPPAVVYDLVATVTNMGRWSPETYKVEWRDGATEAVPGARFRGWNRAKMAGVPSRWWTTGVVRQAMPGKVFSFDVPFSGARWTYRFEAGETGDTCTVTEIREVTSHPLLLKPMDLLLGASRQRQLQAGMEATLQNLKAAAESPA